MYDLPYYKENETKVIFEFIRNYPFAFLAGCDRNKKPVATQVPVLIEQRENKYFLKGHMMRNTDHHLTFVHNPDILAVFTGANTYVSATWYSNPHQASTWNYMSVHVRGKIKFLNEEGLIDILKKLTMYFEINDKNSTTIFDNLTDEYKLPLLKAIVGFEIEIENIQNVFKLSQDRDEKSYHNIIKMLSKQTEDGKAIANEMKQRAYGLFNHSKE